MAGRARLEVVDRLRSGDDSQSVIQWELAINPVGLGGAGRRLVGDHGANLVLVGAVLCAEIASF